ANGRSRCCVCTSRVGPVKKNYRRTCVAWTRRRTRKKRKNHPQETLGRTWVGLDAARYQNSPAVRCHLCLLPSSASSLIVRQNTSNRFSAPTPNLVPNTIGTGHG